MILNQNNEMKAEIVNLEMQLNTCKEQVDNIEKYLRINNIEIVGQTQDENANEEGVILKVQIIWACGVVVSMFEFHRSDRGSNPGRGGEFS